MVKKWLICMLALALAIVPARAIVGTERAYAAPSGGGSGTPSDPYIVLTAQDLSDIRTDPSASYQLGADIDLADYDFGDGGGWKPIGLNSSDTDSAQFTGTLDGDGYAIRHLKIDRAATNHSGLFWIIGSGGTVNNIRLIDADVKGNSFVGILAGAVSGSVQDVSVSGDVAGGSYVGGLAGINVGTIQGAYANVNVTGSEEVGGLVGLLNYVTPPATILNSSAAGSVDGVKEVGGLVGGQYGSIQNSYATSGVTGTQYVGGLVGHIADGAAQIQDSYSTGSVTGTSDFGGLAGAVSGTPTVENSFWDEDRSGPIGSAAGTGKSDADMKSASAYSGYDFTSVWGIREGESYPYLLAPKPEVAVDPLAAADFDLTAGHDELTVTGTVRDDSVGEQVTVGYSVEDGSGSSVKDGTSTLYADGTGQSFTFTVPLSGLSNGTYTVTASATDSYNPAVEASPLAFTVSADVVPPTVGFGTDGSESWAESAATTVTVSDAGSGVDASSLQYVWTTDEAVPDADADWTAFAGGYTLTKSGADGDWYLHVQATDNAGNRADAATQRFRLDAAPPSIAFGTDGSESWAESVSTTVTVDDAGSGIDASSLQYVWTTDEAVPDADADWAAFASGGTLTKSGADGDWYLHVQAADNAGKRADAVTQRFRLDAVLPSVSFGTDGGESWAESASTTVTVDDAGSGIDASSLLYVWTTDEAVPGADADWTAFASGDTLTKSEADGDWYLHVQATDDAGKRVDAATQRFRLDEEPPAIAFGTDGSENWTESAATTVTASDAGSGVDASSLLYVWTTDEAVPGADADWTAFASGDTLTKSGANGDWYLHVQVMDDAGKRADAATQRFRLDAALPSIAFGTDGSENWAESAATTVTVGDAGSGIDASSLLYVWTTDDAAPDADADWTAFASGDTLTKSGANGNWYLHVQATDDAGKRVDGVSQRFRLDQAPPSIAFGRDGSESWAESAATTVTVDDAGSGVDASSLLYVWTTDDAAPDADADWTAFASGETLTKSGADGDWYLHVQAKDSLGHAAAAATKRFRLDHTQPSVGFGTDGSETWAQSASTTVTVGETGSGIDAATLEYVWTEDAAAPAAAADWTTFASGDVLAKSGADGDWYLHIRVQDKLGHSVSAVSQRFRLDRTPPSIAFGTDGTESWAGSASTTVTASDAGSGVDASSLLYVWTTDEATPSADAAWTAFADGDTLTKSGASGDWYLHVKAADQAGNSIDAATKRFRLDASSAALDGLSLSQGTLSPSFAGGTYSYEAAVGYGVDSLTVKPAASSADDQVTVKVNDGAPLTVAGGADSGELALNVGANLIEVAVSTRGGAQQIYTVTVTRAAPSSPLPPVAAGPNIADDASGGVKLTADASNIRKVTRPDGTVVENVEFNEQTLNRALERWKDAAKPVLTVVVDDTEAAVQVIFPAAWMASAAGSVPNGVIETELSGSSFQLNIQAIGLEDVAKRLGVELQDLKVSVGTERVEGSAKTELDQAASAQGGSIVGDAVDYKVTVTTASGQTAEIREFGGAYMARAIVLDALDPEKAKRMTAAYYDPASHMFSFIPAVFAVRSDGKTEMAMNAPHNSIYAILETGGVAFSDLEGHWARDDVEYLASKLVVSGISADRFAPDAEITRAEFTALLVRALGMTANSSGGEAPAFADVAANAWYAPAVEQAVQAGLAQGIATDRFEPNERITREQMAVMIAKALTAVGGAVDGAEAEPSAPPAFTDQASISSWAGDSVERAAAAGIVTGLPDGTFAPSAFATRAQAAVMLRRFLQHVKFVD